MATSGVAVNQACLDQYQELKLKKQHKYVIYKLNPNMTEIIVDKSSKDTDYETFLGDLPVDEPRWAVYDFEYSKGDAGKRNKLVFYSWNPDGAKIKQKMVYASSRDTLRKALVGIAAEIQGTDLDEVGHDTVFDRVSKGA
ncbi:cofilin [Tulasnella sp. 424]|nr:cofilin [Tulasnella sp. 424]